MLKKLLLAAIPVMLCAMPALARDKNIFVQKAEESGEFEIASGDLAKHKAQGPDVQKFAAQMVTDHTAAGEKLKAAAGRAGVPAEKVNKMGEQHAADMAMLQNAKDAVDALYINIQIQAHEEAVTLFRDYVKNGDDPDLRRFAQDTPNTGAASRAREVDYAFEDVARGAALHRPILAGPLLTKPREGRVGSTRRLPLKRLLQGCSVMAERVQLKRTKGWRMPANTVKVDRGSIYGNPFTMEKRERSEAVALFRNWLTALTWEADCGQDYPPMLTKHLCDRRRALLEALPNLRGKNLACWCPLPTPGEPDVCHAAVLLELANKTHD
jgi:putative membrane protein